MSNRTALNVAQQVDFGPTLADTIYRRFFLGAIAVVLTAGATWGALLLWRIGVSHSFVQISVLEINAHGHAQIFGWMGLFIMGFAYQAFPRFWRTTLAAPKLAVVAFIDMIIGIVLQTVGMALVGHWTLAAPVALAGGWLELVAVSIFAGQIVYTAVHAKVPFEPYLGFIFGGLFWFVTMTAFALWHGYTTMTAVALNQLLWHVATYQAPLRDLQIHGLALFMILGVSMRLLPRIYQLPQVSNRRGWWALVLLTLAVFGECILFIAYRWTNSHILAACLMIPWLMLAIGVAMIALPWKLWQPFAQPDRSAKFIRVAYGWLGLSLVMLLMLPAYMHAVHIPFSHAYYGAIRHAITVGFVSLMIMGMAARVAPILNGVAPSKLNSLIGPFVLLNIGCFLRVTLQTMTDFNPNAFKFVGISGTLEVIALTWWSWDLVQTIRAGRKLAQLAPPPPPRRITAELRPAEIAAWFPQTGEVFGRFGLAVRPRFLLPTSSCRVTLARAAEVHNVSLEQLLAELNSAAGIDASGAPATQRSVRLSVLEHAH